ncbi:MAG: hypothetical protein HQK79_06255 [Desulfobacterales bacterium]|nr:hypothetical protein [Desulfobacterales bacterium]MBF0397790.1 hypothetical protein [Desulfobacterales bacterium]
MKNRAKKGSKTNAFDVKDLKIHLEEMAEKCKSISFVGGEPTVNILSVFETLAHISIFPLLIWNTNMYMDIRVPEILYEIVDLYIADLHFYSKQCSMNVAKTSDYFEHASKALKLASQNTKVIVRTLLLPNHIECCFFPIANWMKQNLPEVSLHIMDNYYSQNRESLKKEEITIAKEYAQSIGLNLYKEPFVNERTLQNIASKTIGEEIIIEEDGKIIFPNLTQEFLDISTFLAPENLELKIRKDMFIGGEKIE